MLTWQRWSHCWVHKKLFNLNWVTTTSADKAGILMWRYSPIYVLTDQQLSFKALFSIQAIRFCFGGTPDYLPSRVSWWADLCNDWSQTLPIVSFLLYPPIVFFTLCILHLSLRIFPHCKKSAEVLRHLCFTLALISTPSANMAANYSAWQCSP